eukprot:scaffold3266_cov108-Pinguiococcus_pyrenoidosus.AAC.1
MAPVSSSLVPVVRRPMRSKSAAHQELILKRPSVCTDASVQECFRINDARQRALRELRTFLPFSS